MTVPYRQLSQRQELQHERVLPPDYSMILVHEVSLWLHQIQLQEIWLNGLWQS